MTLNVPPAIPEIVDGEPGAALLREAQRLRSAWDDYRHQLRTASFTGADAAETVEATVNGYRQLTGLRIEDGLLRLGADAVGERINEAMHRAGFAAAAAAGAGQERLLRTLGLTVELMTKFDAAIGNIQPGRTQMD